MKITFSALRLPKVGALAVLVAADGKLLSSGKELDKTTGGALSRAMKANDFKGKKDELLDLLAPSGLDNSRLLLVGVGEPKKLKSRDLQAIGGAIVGHMDSVGETQAAVAVDTVGRDKKAAAASAGHLAYGARLQSYRFDQYKTKKKPDLKKPLEKLTILAEDAAAARRVFAPLDKVAAGVHFTRDLVSEPANVIFPKSLVQRARQLQKLGVKVRALGVAEMKKLGMGALLGVGQGSANESQLLILEWDGTTGGRGGRPIAFVGKGVTFDTGGISIKPAAGMEEMKWDMGGAGVVIGLFHALAGRKARVHAVGVCGLVENMPSGTAQRPGDIVTSMSGQTIEVLNTDAEGRLVLADALWYVQDKYRPKAIVDLATLTGAIIVALGHEHAGLFSNNDELAERLTAAGKKVGEPVWRLPLGEAYDKIIDSDAADMKNVGNRSAGSITAAQFLQRFIKDDTPWAHLDIAGVTWSTKAKPTVPKGGTGFGVRLLNRLVQDHYES
ncbi:MAG TPA: leucyl aminopeptidase [Kiloniellales bacterium]